MNGGSIALLIFAGLALLALVVVVWCMYKDNKDGKASTGSAPSLYGKDDSYIQKVVNELKRRGCKMYGTSHCPWCKRQKALFGDYFKQVDYVDCANGDCTGVKGVPMWRDGSGKELSGYASLPKLCEHFNLNV